MSSFDQKPKPNLGNFASQLHIDPALVASLAPQPNIRLPPMTGGNPALMSPDVASRVFGHYADPPRSPSFNERLEPYVNPDGFAIPGTGGRGRLMPITPFNEPEAPQPKTPGSE